MVISCLGCLIWPFSFVYIARSWLCREKFSGLVVTCGFNFNALLMLGTVLNRISVTGLYRYGPAGYGPPRKCFINPAWMKPRSHSTLLI